MQVCPDEDAAIAIWCDRPRTGFGDLASIEAGTGRTVLLIHGVGLRAEAWGAQFGDLSAAWRVVAVDLPGHGSSVPMPAGASLADYTDRIAAAIRGAVLVAGHSMGAMIALDLAIRYPARVRAVAALNAVFRRDARAREAVRSRAAALPGDRPCDPSATLERWFGAAHPREARACRRWLEGADPAGYKAAYTVFALEDGPSDGGLAGLDRPALFLTGSEEPNSTPAMSRAMAARAAFGTAEIIHGAAHMMPMTHAAQVNGALSGFFAGVSRTEGS